MELSHIDVRFTKWSPMSEPQNPYAPTSEIRVHPDAISFEGIVSEENYRKLLPKKEIILFLTLAFLLIAVALPVLITASFFAIFVDGDAGMIVGSVGMTLLTSIALVFCIRMSSSRNRARAYLKKFPDLLGPLKGTFSSTGLLLEDEEKTHWFPWVLLSHLVVTEAGVRVPLGEDPRRFLALHVELFDGYQPSDMEQMRIRNRTAQTTYEQLAADSAAAFQSEVGSANYYSGWIQQPVTWSVWITLLLGPLILGIYIVFLVFQSVQAQWSWVRLGLVVVLLLAVLPSAQGIVRLLRNRNRSTAMCWGWLSETELIYGSNFHVIRIPMASMKYIGRDAETLQFQLPSGASFYLFRAHFQETGHFEKIRALLERRTIEGQSCSL